MTIITEVTDSQIGKNGQDYSDLDINLSDLVDCIQNLLFDLGHSRPTVLYGEDHWFKHGKVSHIIYYERTLGMPVKKRKITFEQAKQLLIKNALIPETPCYLTIGNNVRVLAVSRNLRDFDGRVVSSTRYKSNYLSRIKKHITDYKSIISAI